MLHVGGYAQMYPHTILSQGMDSRDGLPLGALPSGILKIGKYCPGHKVRSPRSCQFGKNEIGMDAILTAVMDINRVFLRPKLSETGPAKNAPTNAAT